MTSQNVVLTFSDHREPTIRTIPAGHYFHLCLNSNDQITATTHAVDQLIQETPEVALPCLIDQIAFIRII